MSKEMSAAQAYSWCLASILISILSTILRGYAFTFLWRWFIVPVMHTQEISITAAIGLSLIIDHFKGIVEPDKEKVKAAEKDLPGHS